MIVDNGKLEKLLKLNPGERANHVLYYLLEPHLFGYWTFLQPKHKGTELADVLFVWGDVCILFEVKTREKARENDEDWVRDRIAEALSSLNARADMLKRGEVEEIRNTWRGTVQWSDLHVKYYWGTIVLNHESAPYDPIEVAKECLGKSSIPIQVLSLYDLSQLVRVVNTPGDLIVYYEARRELAKRGFELRVHDEKAVFNTIVEEWADIVLNSPGHSLSREEVEEQQEFMREASHVLFRSALAKDSVCESLAASLLLNMALGSTAKKATPDVTGKRVGNAEHDMWVTAMGCIAELSRRRRCQYGEIWLEVARKALKLHLPQHRGAHSPTRRRSYVMAAVEGDTRAGGSVLLPEVRRRMVEDKSESCLCLAGKANTIVATFECLLAWVKGTSTDDLGESEVLDVSTLYVDRGG